MSSPAVEGDFEPGFDCLLCPRLANMRQNNRRHWPAWHNSPVSPFGSLEAALLIVGLAPGLRGANRTGRPFTGDRAGDTLYCALLRYGFAHGCYDRRPDDGLTLIDCRLTNAVRCAPPQNKPETSEIAACRSFLAKEIQAMPRLQAILALGVIAHGAVLRCLGQKASAYAFAHGACHVVGQDRLLFDSYHCSRYNTNTGRLTQAMFDDVIARIRQHIPASSQ